MYYGIQLQLDHVPGNTYLNALLMGISEIPGYIAMAFATKSRLGRTGTLFISLIVAGVSMSLTGIDSGRDHLATRGNSDIKKPFILCITGIPNKRKGSQEIIPVL